MLSIKILKFQINIFQLFELIKNRITMVYPALLAAVSDAAHPNWRASSLEVYRFWRDMGYTIGALMVGIVGNFFGLMWAVHIAGIVTFISGIVVWVKMKETKLN